MTSKLHSMKLTRSPFLQIKNGSKTVELRLHDEKRQNIWLGDFIEFTLIDNPDEKLLTRVTGLRKFPNFSKLYSAYPKESLGYKFDEIPNPDDMNEYYSKENQEKYGVLAIEIRVTELQRFLDAQDNGYQFRGYDVPDYSQALTEIRDGYKYSHWIWYVFPQICGLGYSPITSFFAIKDKTEAEDYISHPVLGARLVEISSELIKHETNDPMEILGDVDSFKLKSCMTLFKNVAPDVPVFAAVLDKFCMGDECLHTLEKLNNGD